MHNIIYSTNGFQFNIPWKAPGDCVAKRKHWNKQDDNDETNVSRLHLQSLRKKGKSFIARLSFGFVLHVHLEDYF